MKSIITRWYDRLIAADPGLTRLRSAGRAALTVAVTVLLMHLLVLLTGQSFFSFIIGIVVSMIASLAVNDPGRKQKMITAALLPVPSIVALTIGGFLSGSTYIAEGVFVVVMFISVYIRRYGPRWFGFGMIIFISYFFAMFLGAGPKQLPWMYLAIVGGAGVNFLFRFVIIPDAGQFTPSMVMPAVRARLRLILKQLRAGIIHPKKIGRYYNRMRRQAVYLNEITVLDIGNGRNETWDDAFFKIDLIAQHITELGREKLLGQPEENTEEIIVDIDLLVSELQKKSPQTPDRLNWSSDKDNKFLKAFQSLLDAVADAGPARKQEEDSDAEADDPDQEKENGKVLSPITRKAIQVAVANVFAIAGGELLSSKRWYWAAITAFIVFNGTTSRGDVFVKGWQRVAGTFFGVGAGILIATLVSGNQVVSFILIFISIFLGFYFRSVSYAMMIFFITILLALLYGLLGFFSIDLLSLRLEETVIGAVSGIIVAVFLFPAKTRRIALQQSQAFLGTLSHLIGDSIAHIHDQVSEDRILARLQELDDTFQELRKAARPLTLRIKGLIETRTSQHWLRVMLQLRYQAHILVRQARVLSSIPSVGVSDLPNFANHLCRQIDQISDAISNATPRKKTLRGIQSLPAEPRLPSFENPDAVYKNSLKKINCILAILVRDIGSGSSGLEGKNSNREDS